MTNKFNKITINQGDTKVSLFLLDSQNLGYLLIFDLVSDKFIEGHEVDYTGDEPIYTVVSLPEVDLATLIFWRKQLRSICS
tara:strand:+ start:218 stop:460 length:243 start_codon:yes stop_codon:yes gene_type:complete